MSFKIDSIVALILWAICFLSCGRAVGTMDVDMVFPETVSLTSEEKIIADVYLKYPYRIRLDDTSLYVVDIHPTDYYCHAFSYPAMVLRRSFAKRGEAPHEFLDAGNIRLDEQDGFWILDANRKKIVRMAHDLSAIPQQEATQLDEALIRTLDFDRVNDSTFIVPDYTGLHRLCLLNRDGKLVRQLFSIPAAPDDGSHAGDSNIPLAQAWRSFLHYHPGHGIVAMVTQMGQVLEIYDIKNERVVNIVCPKGMEPQFTTAGNYAVPTGIMGYSDVHVGREHIYAVFWGHSFDDIKQQKVTKEGGRYIHVFDLQGVPVRQYLLDRHITGFHVDEENSRIIGLDVNSDQPIVEYMFGKS